MSQLAKRATNNARQQEGQSPTEDPTALLAEHTALANQLELLIAQINTTNLSVEVEPGLSMTQALARRDVLRTKWRVRTSVADAASERQDVFTRTELRYVPALDVAGLRSETDNLSQQLRELDTSIQEANWSHELLT